MVYNSAEPSYHILICLIQVWDMEKDGDPMYVPKNCMTITEVQDIEISESYTELINKALITFPRGTVIRRTVVPENESDVGNSSAWDVGLSNSGVVQVTRKDAVIANTDSFNIGQRIRIYLGYTTDPNVANYAKATNYSKKNIYSDSDLYKEYMKAFELKREAKSQMDIMFDGYITKVSVDTPIEIECENLASVLRRVTCPDKDIKKCSINRILCSGTFKNDGQEKEDSAKDKQDGEEGEEENEETEAKTSKAKKASKKNKNTKPSKKKKAKKSSTVNGLALLKGTGLSLHPETQKLDIKVGHCKLTPDKTLADLIEEWANFGVYTFVTVYDGKPVLQCARAYFTNAEKDSILNAIPQPGGPVPIKFNYHVAKNELKLAVVYDGYYAVDAEGIGKEGDNDQFIRLTICKNPDYETKGGEKYRVLNESKLSKTAIKKGFKALTKSSNDKRNDLSLYTRIPYKAKRIPITREQLMEEAANYMEGYNFNGIDGSLTLFGDLHLHSGYRVYIQDDRYPKKNGTYIVGEVDTSFGINGYRQTVKLPYCIERPDQPDKSKKTDESNKNAKKGKHVPADSVSTKKKKKSKKKDKKNQGKKTTTSKKK